MKAVRIHQYGDASTLKLEEVPRLSITDDQLLVRIRDAGVNPIDWKIRQGAKQAQELSESGKTRGKVILKVA
jgi:NADPH:quinone reductase-like Zn-dependent oxidoreductase